MFQEFPSYSETVFNVGTMKMTTSLAFYILHLSGATQYFPLSHFSSVPPSLLAPQFIQANSENKKKGFFLNSL